MRNLFLKSILLLVLCARIEAKEYIGVINITTNVSDGRYSIEEIVERAKKKGISIIMLSDHFLLKVEYGIFPFRNLIKKKFEKNSIFTYGIGNYLEKVKKINEKYTEVILIPGVKVTPFYFWEGSILKKNLTLRNFHKEMLIFGLEEKDLENLPVIGNYPLNLKDLISPLLLICFSIFLIRKKKVVKYRLRFLKFSSSYFPYRKIGILILMFSLVALINNLQTRKIHQYKNFGEIPYQLLINYVNKKGGFIFWSAPEAKSLKIINKIKLLTKPYPESLLNTKDYTGFACLYEGYKIISKPAGIWDKVLNKFCNGKLKRPVWIIGEVDYHGEKNKSIDEVLTVFNLKEFNEKNVFKTLKEGKYYVVRKTDKYRIILDYFTISDNRGKIGIIGDVIEIESFPEVNIKVKSSDGKKRLVKIRVIRNGKIIKFIKKKMPVQVKFIDRNLERGRLSYYRLDIETNYPHKLLTNPIFVKLK